MQKIEELIKNIGISEDSYELYGKYKAKIADQYLSMISQKKTGKLILVTATNPTPMGEGKTTQSIGLSMALNQMGKKSMVCLREPSLGPVFGIKGGAIGGGAATVEPSQDINLHFNGDFHAITSANNLLCAAIDNHIFQGNALHIDKNRIMIKRVIDMNDRSLRRVEVGKNQKETTYQTGFELTVASELMAICALSLTKKELKERMEQMIIGYTIEGKPVYAQQLHVTNAMLALLEKVLNPNLVQTSESTPAMIHLGPFANIAHGCNSLLATKMALHLTDYVVTEAGFGADLGAEKFMDIKCRIGKIKPDVAVLVTTIKAMKYNGGLPIDQLNTKNTETLQKGMGNLEAHIENLKKFGVPVVVCLNQFDQDTEEEIKDVIEFVEKRQIPIEISTAYREGGKGAKKLASTIVEVLEKQDFHFQYLYELEDSIENKISQIAMKIYGAREVIYSKEAKEKIEEIKKLKKENLPICMAKTPSSFSDDPKLLGRPKDFAITIQDMKLNNGAGFIVAYAGNVLTMPGLAKNSNYEHFPDWIEK